MIEWIPHDDKCRMPPESIGYAVRAMEFPTSTTVVKTDKYISIDFVPAGFKEVKTVALYNFAREDNSWLLTGWNELDDEHRLLLRTHSHRHLFAIGGYKDHRYYTLEALT